MQALLDATWRNIQAELCSRVGGSVYEAWLRDLRPLALERGVFHLEARNRMTSERVAQFYAEVLGELLSGEIGTTVGVAVDPSPESLLPDELAVGPRQPIIDPSNRTAWLLLQALFEERPLPSRQFVVHGPPGAGKSFLLGWWRSARKGRCLGFRGLDLVKAFQATVREGRLETLVGELSRAEDLVLDELHRTSGYVRLQQELARVLETRAEAGRTTLIASRWHPREIRRIDPRLETWLLAGFVTRLDLPGPKARLTYLRALEGTRAMNGRAGAIEALARDVQGGYPDLRRAWAIEAHGRTGPGRRRYFELIDPRSTFDRLRERVRGHFDVPVEELVGQSQRRRVSQARKILGWLCVREGLSRAEVGRFLGRTRAAISYQLKSLEEEMGRDRELRRVVEGLR